MNNSHRIGSQVLAVNVLPFRPPCWDVESRWGGEQPGINVERMTAGGNRERGGKWIEGGVTVRAVKPGTKADTVRYLFIVPREQTDLFEYLTRDFAEVKEVRVLLDRRVGDRRQLLPAEKVPRPAPDDLARADGLRMLWHRIRESLFRWTSRLSRRSLALPGGHSTTPLDPRPPVSATEIGKTVQAVHALKAGVDRSLDVLRALGAEVDRQLKVQTPPVGIDSLRALGQVVDGTSHNLNNALATILGYTELLLKEPLDEQTERRLNIIREAALEVGVMVHRLRELAAPHPHGAFGPVVLSEVVAEALEVTQPRWRDEFERRGVILTVVRELDSVLAVEGNHADLREALVYLILNRVDAMASGGTLTLRSRSVEPSWVELEVADTGAERPAGLSGASAIVQQNGGELFVVTAPGTGTVVRLRLPESRFYLVRSDGAVERCAPDQARRILLVDDDSRLLHALTDLLEASGHQVRMATSGADALARLEEDAADVVITDLGMPGMTGWELAERIKTRSPQTRVFLLTGWGEAVADSDASRFVDRIIAKPVRADALLRYVGEGLCGAGRMTS